MLGYTFRRLLSFIPLLWAVATVTFLLMHAVPGGPFDAGPRPLRASTIEALEQKYDLDGSLGKQYLSFMGGLLQGDFGLSFQRNVPVTELIEARYLTTLQLGMSAFAFALVAGVSLGILAAIYQNTIIDHLSVSVATVGVAVPSFVLAVFLVVVFSLKLDWFDVIGWEMWNPRKMVLPTVSLGLFSLAFIARITRAAMLETLHDDYIRTARAKGLKERQLVIRHAVRNSMIPVLTLLGPVLATFITGSFIIEKTFSIPGIGTLFVDAVGGRDYGVIMGTTLLYAFAVAVMNLLVDLSYGLVDPRVRYS